MKLAIKLLSILFLSTSILFAILVFLHIDSQKRDLTEAFVDRVKATSFIFTSSITDTSDLSNTEFLRQSINYAMWGDSEILGIHLYGLTDNGLELLVSNDPLMESLEPESLNNAVLSEGKTLNEIRTKGSQDILSIYQPISISGRIVGTVQIDSTLERVRNKVNSSIYKLSIQYVFLITVFLSFLYLWLRKLIFKPLALLDEAVTAVKHNNLDHVIQTTSNDEFGKLSVLFNEMLQNLKSANASLLEHTHKIEAEVAERTREVQKEKDRLEETVNERTGELQRLKDTLEATVEARTNELQKTVASLEQMNGFMMDRELTMVELKKKLAQCSDSKDATSE